MAENIHQEDTEEIGASSTEKLRRFSLGVGFALLIYVIADGEFNPTFQSPLTPIVQFKTPAALLWAFILSAIYASHRYWYYGIHLAPTRTKMRAYLRNKESTLFFDGNEKDYENACARPGQSPAKDYLNILCRKIPPGHPRSACIVITHAAHDPEVIKEQVAKKLEHYFPGLKASNISTSVPQDALGWAHVSSISKKTCWLSGIENADLYLPIIVNVFALFALTVRKLCP